MRKFFNVLALILFFSTIIKAQGYPTADTIIVYDVIANTIDTILPVVVDPSITFDYTSSSPGSLGNQVPLSGLPAGRKVQFHGGSLSENGALPVTLWMPELPE